MAITHGNISILNPIERKVYGTGETAVVFLQPESQQPTYQSSGALYRATQPRVTQPAAPGATYQQETDLHQIDPWLYGAGMMFGLPGMIGSWLYGMQQGAPEQQTTSITGLTPEQAYMLGQQPVTPAAPAAPGAGGWMDQIGTVADIGLKIAPLILIIGLIGSIKKIF